MVIIFWLNHLLFLFFCNEILEYIKRYKKKQQNEWFKRIYLNFGKTKTPKKIKKKKIDSSATT